MSAVQILPTPILSQPKLVTPSDFLNLPDEGKGYELVDGILKELNVSAKSSRTALRIGAYLDRFCQTTGLGWVFTTDAIFKCFRDDMDKIRRPDAAVMLLTRYSEAIYERERMISVNPDLVVEVLSPNDLAQEVNRKTREWLIAGAKMVWVIDPDEKIVVCHTPVDVVIRREGDALTGDPVLPGFSVPVVELFLSPNPAKA